MLVRRRYVLEDGPIARLDVEPNRGVFKTQLGGFGIEFGAGHANGEPVDVVRLAPITRTLVLPTHPRRLAIVPSSAAALTRALRLAAGEAAAVAPYREAQGEAPRVSR